MTRIYVNKTKYYISYIIMALAVLGFISGTLIEYKFAKAAIEWQKLFDMLGGRSILNYLEILSTYLFEELIILLVAIVVFSWGKKMNKKSYW